jgi:hypothetical protein
MTEQSGCKDSLAATSHPDAMSDAQFPQRFIERTVGYIHPDMDALKVCCLVRKARVAGSRCHHFYERIVNGSLELDRWMGAFVYPGFIRQLHVSHSYMLEGVLSSGLSGSKTRGTSPSWVPDLKPET